jgi:hypothetical protein
MEILDLKSTAARNENKSSNIRIRLSPLPAKIILRLGPMQEWRARNGRYPGRKRVK